MWCTFGIQASFEVRTLHNYIGTYCTPTALASTRWTGRFCRLGRSLSLDDDFQFVEHRVIALDPDDDFDHRCEHDLWPPPKPRRKPRATDKPRPKRKRSGQAKPSMPDDEQGSGSGDSLDEDGIPPCDDGACDEIDDANGDESESDSKQSTDGHVQQSADSSSDEARTQDGIEGRGSSASSMKLEDEKRLF